MQMGKVFKRKCLTLLKLRRYANYKNIKLWELQVIYFKVSWGVQRFNRSEQSGPVSNDNEGMLHSPQSPRTGTSPSDAQNSLLFFTPL